MAATPAVSSTTVSTFAVSARGQPVSSVSARAPSATSRTAVARNAMRTRSTREPTVRPTTAEATTARDRSIDANAARADSKAPMRRPLTRQRTEAVTACTAAPTPRTHQAPSCTGNRPVNRVAASTATTASAARPVTESSSEPRVATRARAPSPRARSGPRGLGSARHLAQSAVVAASSRRDSGPLATASDTSLQRPVQPPRTQAVHTVATVLRRPTRVLATIGAA